MTGDQSGLNQSGLNNDELNHLRLEFTGDDIRDIQRELGRLAEASAALDQDQMQRSVDEILHTSGIFRAVIRGPSGSDGVYFLSTEPEGEEESPRPLE